MSIERQPHDTEPSSCSVSIIIKSLNEEKRISATIESALRAVAGLGGEVVLADSCSTDRTVEFAKRYPIRVVQLVHSEERCCGIGPQLGYQHSFGNFVYILDGDMEMKTGFLEQAIAFMADHADVAGVGGEIIEQNTDSLEYRGRSEREYAHTSFGEVDRLDMGGLYRRSAIQAVGYFSDRNLHSYEEFDLAVRLRTQGWRLWRLPFTVASHYGHDAPPYRLLMSRWRTGYLWGPGELVRAAAGKPGLGMVLSGASEFRLYIGVLIWWASLISIPFWSVAWPIRLAWLLVLFAAPFLVMLWRKRSVAKAVYSVVSWCFYAAGLVRGLLRGQKPAQGMIASKVINEPGSDASMPPGGMVS